MKSFTPAGAEMTSGARVETQTKEGNSEVKNKSPDKEEAIIQKESTGPDPSNLTRKCVVNLSPSAKLPEKQDVTPRKGKILECPSCKKQYKSMGVGPRSYIEHVKVCTTQMKTHAKVEETDIAKFFSNKVWKDSLYITLNMTVLA